MNTGTVCMVLFEVGSQVDEARGVVRYRGALGLLDQQMLRDSRLSILSMCYALFCQGKRYSLGNPKMALAPLQKGAVASTHTKRGFRLRV